VRAALLIARKDLRQRLRDRSALIYGIIAPLGLAILFSFIFNPLDDATFDAEYVLVDEDGGEIALAFGEALEGLEEEDFAVVRTVESVRVARQQVETGSDAFAGDDEEKADAAFVIPEGFSEAVLAGEGAEMTVIGATGSELAAQVAYSFAQGFASELAAVDVAVRTVLPDAMAAMAEEQAAASGMPPGGAGAVPPGTEGVPPGTEGAPPGSVTPEMLTGMLAAEAASTVNPITVEDVSASTKQLDNTTYLSAGMAVFFLFFTVAFGVSGLLEERRIGTMVRLLAAPISRTSIIVGKALTSFVLGILSMTVLVVASSLLIGAEWGNPLGVAALVVAAVIAAMGILAVVAAVAKNQEQAGNFQAIIAIVLAFLGGTFFTVAQVGGFMETLSLFTPHAWFLRGLGDLQGGDVADVLPSVGALLAFGLVTGGLAWFFLVKAVGRTR
jgi:ABC-2 type transport system permease protein